MTFLGVVLFVTSMWGINPGVTAKKLDLLQFPRLVLGCPGQEVLVKR